MEGIIGGLIPTRPIAKMLSRVVWLFLLVAAVSARVDSDHEDESRDDAESRMFLPNNDLMNLGDTKCNVEGDMFYTRGVGGACFICACFSSGGYDGLLMPKCMSCYGCGVHLLPVIDVPQPEPLPAPLPDPMPMSMPAPMPAPMPMPMPVPMSGPSPAPSPSPMSMCPPPIVIPGPPRPYPVPVPVPGKNVFVPVPVQVPSAPEKIYIRGPSFPVSEPVENKVPMPFLVNRPYPVPSSPKYIPYPVKTLVPGPIRDVPVPVGSPKEATPYGGYSSAKADATSSGNRFSSANANAETSSGGPGWGSFGPEGFPGSGGFNPGSSGWFPGGNVWLPGGGRAAPGGNGWFPSGGGPNPGNGGQNPGGSGWYPNLGNDGQSPGGSGWYSNPGNDGQSPGGSEWRPSVGGWYPGSDVSPGGDYSSAQASATASGYGDSSAEAIAKTNSGGFGGWPVGSSPGGSGYLPGGGGYLPGNGGLVPGGGWPGSGDYGTHANAAANAVSSGEGYADASASANANSGGFGGGYYPGGLSGGGDLGSLGGLGGGLGGFGGSQASALANAQSLGGFGGDATSQALATSQSMGGFGSEAMAHSQATSFGNGQSSAQAMSLAARMGRDGEEETRSPEDTENIKKRSLVYKSHPNFVKIEDKDV